MALGDRCEEVELPAFFEDAWHWHRTIMAAEMAKHLAGHYERARDALSAPLLRLIAAEPDIELCAWEIRITFEDGQTRDYPTVNLCETIRVDLR